MLFTALAFAVAAANVQPVPLERITCDHARSLDGRPIVVSFIVATPPYTWRGETIVGAWEHPDGSARIAHFAGTRLDVEPGKRVRVAGVLRVIQHPPTFIAGQPWPGWTEVRVTEGKPNAGAAGPNSEADDVNAPESMRSPFSPLTSLPTDTFPLLPSCYPSGNRLARICRVRPRTPALVRSCSHEQPGRAGAGIMKHSGGSQAEILFGYGGNPARPSSC